MANTISKLCTTQNLGKYLLAVSVVCQRPGRHAIFIGLINIEKFTVMSTLPGTDNSITTDRYVCMHHDQSSVFQLQFAGNQHLVPTA